MITRRPYQNEALGAAARRELRSFALLWERQAGKSTTMADMALLDMMEAPGRTVVYGSASLLLGTEITLKQEMRIAESVDDILSREAAIIADRLTLTPSRVQGERAREASASAGEGETRRDVRLTTFDTRTHKELPDLKPDDLTDLFTKQRLEFRVYHDRGRYSRTKVIAPNVATARGWAGTVILDEIAFIRALKELITAVLPIISTKKDFRIIYSTTPPEFNDTHYSFEMLAPPPELEFKPNAAGNWYESRGGISVHRADAYDTYLAGKKIFDIKSGRSLTPDEAFARALNKDGHRIAHFLAWLAGGAAACDALRLTTAQERGAKEGCKFFEIRNDLDFIQALNWLAEHIHPTRKVGLGFDVATTTKLKSNPSALTIGEEDGPDLIERAVMIWKTRDPDVAKARLKAVLNCISRRAGGRAKALAIDATSEKLFAESVRKEFRAMAPVILVVGSEAVELPGLEKPINYKEYTGQQYVSKLDDNHLTVPPGNYIYDDHRLVLRDGGRFVCEPDDQGRHGDTFDGGKLALHALRSNKGISTTKGIFAGFNSTRAQWQPRMRVRVAPTV